MNLDTYKDCISGYQERIHEQQVLAVQTGYWAGYYSRAKKPKDLKQIVGQMERTRAKGNQVHAPSVDVEGYLEQERKFNQLMKGGDTNG